ncbi:MAG: hypothetical protein ACM3KR_04570 [Deltaproteobacteria bacterium]
MWKNQESDIMLGGLNKEDMRKGGLYWQLIDFQNEEKGQKVKEYILARLAQHKLIMPAENPDVSVKSQSFFGQSKLVVHIERKFKIPPGRLLKVFGMTPYYTISVNAEAVIDQPAEFIRNTDMVLDIEKDFELKYPEYGKRIRKIREEMNKVENHIADYFAGDEARFD